MRQRQGSFRAAPMTPEGTQYYQLSRGLCLCSHPREFPAVTASHMAPDFPIVSLFSQQLIMVFSLGGILMSAVK